MLKNLEAVLKNKNHSDLNLVKKQMTDQWETSSKSFIIKEAIFQNQLSKFSKKLSDSTSRDGSSDDSYKRETQKQDESANNSTKRKKMKASENDDYIDDKLYKMFDEIDKQKRTNQNAGILSARKKDYSNDAKQLYLRKEPSKVSRGSRNMSQISGQVGASGSRNHPLHPYQINQNTINNQSSLAAIQKTDHSQNAFQTLQQPPIGRRVMVSRLQRGAVNYEKLEKQVISKAKQQSDSPSQLTTIDLATISPVKQRNALPKLQFLSTVQSEISKIERKAHRKVLSMAHPDQKSEGSGGALKKTGSKLLDSIAQAQQEDEYAELPTAERMVKPQLTSNDYLKLFMGKNDTHDPDREKARSILKNLQMPSKTGDLEKNPFFNHQKQPDLLLNLHIQDLFSIGQIQADVINQIQQRQNDSDGKSQRRNIKLARLNRPSQLHDDDIYEELQVSSQRDRRSNSVISRTHSNSDLQSEYNLISNILGSVRSRSSSSDVGLGDDQASSQGESFTNPYQDQPKLAPHKGIKSQRQKGKVFKMIDAKRLAARTIEAQIALVPKEAQNLELTKISNLSKEVQDLSINKLKKAFHHKIAEMNAYVKRGKLSEYNTQTLKLGPASPTSLESDSVSCRSRQTNSQHPYLPQARQQLANRKLKVNMFESPLKQQPSIKSNRSTGVFVTNQDREKEFEEKEENALKDRLYERIRNKIATQIQMAFSKHAEQKHNELIQENPKTLYDNDKTQHNRSSSVQAPPQKYTSPPKKLEPLKTNYITGFKRESPPQAKSKIILANSSANFTQYQEGRSKYVQLFDDLKSKQSELLSRLRGQKKEKLNVVDELEQNQEKVEDLLRFVNDRLDSQVKDVVYSDDEDKQGLKESSSLPTTLNLQSTNQNCFELYRKDFDKKILNWYVNELREINPESQKLNYVALQSVKRRSEVPKKK
ncbi:hypothetical protein FGO68_gene4625 [Halteria grandinella]|uniref:Uncharacterized protein n=1 Tax=Halteria grandinella TaxID=5974 RepID=A0A8J8T6K2_HALGN|nr:hypothetical protein FGO68_gene4625 [Halteria grandinella]